MGATTELSSEQSEQDARTSRHSSPHGDDPGNPIADLLTGHVSSYTQANFNPNVIVEAALQHGGVISRFELTEPSLTDIFIEKVGVVSEHVAPSSVLSA